MTQIKVDDKTISGAVKFVDIQVGHGFKEDGKVYIKVSQTPNDAAKANSAFCFSRKHVVHFVDAAIVLPVDLEVIATIPISED